MSTLLGVAALVPAGIAAQSVRGTVVNVGGIPVPGVVVQLLDSTSAVRARALSDERGEFLIIAPRGGTYRVQTLRIGFRPVVSSPFALAVGQEASEQFALTALRSGLDTVHVGGKNVCGRASVNAAATATVWEQARAALTAAELASANRTMMATRLTYAKRLDNVGFRTLEQHTSVGTAVMAQPWPAPSVASLHGAGYIIIGDDSTSYRAPGLDMLASLTFIDDHCFRLTSGRDGATLGIAFEPIPDRRKLGEIRGTVWIDRATSELRGMEFTYVDGGDPDLAEGARGAMHFVRLKNGAWAISRWEIQMPVLELRTAASGTRTGAIAAAESRVVVSSVRVAGGELAVATTGSDTLWSQPPLVLKGDVRDSTSGRGVTHARVSLAGTAQVVTAGTDGRFAISGVLPGEYFLDVRTPSLDSLGTSSRRAVSITDGAEQVHVRVPTATQVAGGLCANARNRTPGTGLPGMIVGAVAAPDAAFLPATTKVIAEWTDRATGAPHRAETRPDSAGGFRFCGAPLATSIAISAAADSVSSDPVPLALAAEHPMEQVQLFLDHRVTPRAVFVGTVADSGHQAIAGAEVFFPDLSRTTMTDGHGAFRIRDVPVGTHRVMVRKVGYGPLDVELPFGANEAISRHIVLTRMTVLNKVTVTTGRAMPDFEDNRKLGLGTFMTREFLETQEGRPLSEVFGAVPGVRLFWSPGRPETYIASSRRCRYFADGRSEKCDPCYAQVFLDGMQVTRVDRFNINEILPKDIEAIEYYAGPSETPMRYGVDNATCGVVVIHTIMNKDRRQP